MTQYLHAIGVIHGFDLSLFIGSFSQQNLPTNLAIANSTRSASYKTQERNTFSEQCTIFTTSRI